MFADGDNGGAICCKSSSLTISLQSCSIINCNSTKNGCGVYVSGTSNTLSIYDCLLKDCVTTSGESPPGGGGLYTSGSTSSLTINSSSFLTCKSNGKGYGGGGFHANKMKNVILSSSRILFCSTISSGGGVYISEPTPVSYFSTLFGGNSATGYGGAIRELSNSQYSSATHIKFCFFTGNTATAQCGSDFSVSSEMSSSPFIHSFSTASSNRAFYRDSTGTSYTDHSNWLPLTIINVDALEAGNIHNAIGTHIYTYYKNYINSLVSIAIIIILSSMNEHH